MDDKHSHIDDWLRKTAEQQPAPDDADRELKRQAWSKMAALLDEDDAGRPQPRVIRFRIKWAAILIPFFVTSVVFATTLWLAPRYFKRTKPAKQVHVSPPTPGDRAGRQNKMQQTHSDTPLLNINTTPWSGPADSIKGAAGRAAAIDPSQKGAANAAAGSHHIAGPVTNNPAAGNNSNKDRSGGNNQEGINRPGSGNVDVRSNHGKPSGRLHAGKSGKPGPVSRAEPQARAGGIAPAAAVKGNSAAAKEEKTPHNKLNNAAGSRTVNENEAVAAEQTGTDKRSVTMPGERALFTAADAGLAVIHPVRSRNVFALQLPALSAARREQHLPVSLVAGNGVITGHPESRWALQAGLLSPLNSAVGIRAGILYRYPFGSGWYLLPQIGASYLTGYNRQFTHVSISKHQKDSSTGSAQDDFEIDTVTTPYTLKRAFAGSLGINLGYQMNRLAVSAGLAYSMAVPSGRQDTAVRRTGIVRDSSGISYTGASFSAGKLPANQQLSFNVDLSWYVLPRLQAGVNYRVAIWNSKAAKEFRAPLQKLQDNSMLELYIRIPIGR